MLFSKYTIFYTKPYTPKYTLHHTVSRRTIFHTKSSMYTMILPYFLDKRYTSLNPTCNMIHYLVVFLSNWFIIL